MGSSTAVGSWLRFPLSNKAFSWPPGWNKQTPPSRRRGGKSRDWKCQRSPPGPAEPGLCCRRVRGAWVGAHGAPLAHSPACWDSPPRQRALPVSLSGLVGLSSTLGPAKRAHSSLLHSISSSTGQRFPENPPADPSNTPACPTGPLPLCRQVTPLLLLKKRP